MVDLPAPDDPTIAVVVPGSTTKLIAIVGPLQLLHLPEKPGCAHLEFVIY
ncbi:MAG: hypothetical protein ACD_45C00662G0003 [uncultured bacterium]|nr:MAG: hypothetical protein ACD_45C00662G0003 [uncultured bacterium]